MGKQQTKHQIKVGLGAPLLRDKPFGEAYDNLLLDNCLHNYAYDPQSEGTRGWYAYQLLRRSGNRKRLIKQFKKRFGGIHEVDTHATDQAFAVAGELYRAGEMKKATIIGKFRELSAKPNAHDHGWDTVIHLGRRGLYAYMEVTGRQLKGEKLDWTSKEVLTRKQTVRKAIEAWGGKLPPTKKEKNKHVRRYRRRVLERDYPRTDKGTGVRARTFDELLAQIAAGRAYGNLRGLYAMLTAEQFRLLAERERQETDPVIKGMYLRAFGEYDYPGDPLELVDRLDSKEPRLSNSAGRILGRVASPAIRRIARSRLKQRKTVALSISILEASYQESDDALIYRTIRNVSDPHDLHEIGYAVQGIFRAHPNARLQRTLGHLYANGRCGVCRLEFLKHLRAAGYLSKRRAREMRYDSYAPTRASTWPSPTTQ